MYIVNNVLHYEVVRANIVKVADVWMIERRYRSSFALEAFELSLGNFDRDDSIKARVISLVDVTHAARTDRRKIFVRAEFFAGRQGHLSDRAKFSRSGNAQVLYHGVSVPYFFKFGVWRRIAAPAKSRWRVADHSGAIPPTHHKKRLLSEIPVATGGTTVICPGGAAPIALVARFGWYRCYRIRLLKRPWQLVDRRDVLRGGVAAAASLVLPQFRSIALAQAAYPKTTGILQRSRDGEQDAYLQYVAFTRQAKSDGYPGIAYLFSALATAEFTHGQNFEKLLARLGAEITPHTERQVQVGSTRQNLIKAAADEIDSVDTFYPTLLKELKPEGFQEAITITTWAWETEKQHLGILKSIQRWTPNHFEAVAKKIEKETGQYFVCQICGGTSVKIPQGKCPICRFPSDNLRKIEPPI